MKKMIIGILLTGLFASCGPTRMKCGPRGICSAPAVEKSMAKT